MTKTKNNLNSDYELPSKSTEIKALMAALVIGAAGVTVASEIQQHRNHYGYNLNHTPVRSTPNNSTK